MKIDSSKYPTLEISIDEALSLFTAEGEFVYNVKAMTNQEEFNAFPLAAQEMILQSLETHKKIYKRLADYLTSNHVPLVQEIFHLDVEDNVKPKSMI